MQKSKMIILLATLIFSSVVSADGNSKVECKKFFQAWSLNAALENSCGFNGGVSKKLADVVHANCDSVLSEKEMKKLHNAVFTDLRGDEKKYGIATVCENAKKGYNDLSATSESSHNPTCEEQFESWSLMNTTSSVCQFSQQVQLFIAKYASNVKSQCSSLSTEKMNEINLQVMKSTKQSYTDNIKEMGENNGEKLFCAIFEKQFLDMQSAN